MAKLLVMEGSVERIIVREFVRCGRVDADIRSIAAEGGPELPPAFAEGNGRTLAFSQAQLRPAERIMDDSHRQIHAVGHAALCRGNAFYSGKMLPQK
jgi:hypothetical protein